MENRPAPVPVTKSGASYVAMIGLLAIVVVVALGLSVWQPWAR